MPSSRSPFVALAAAAVLGGGVATGAGALFGDEFGAPQTTTVTAPPVVAGAQPVIDAGLPTAREVYERATGSVASIEAVVVQRSDSPFGPAGVQQGLASGSGFVVSADGLIVTNAHVVDGARQMRVALGDGEARPAELIASDPSIDLALVRVELADGERLDPLALTGTAGLRVGDATYAIGSPFGLEQTLTTGVVSAKQRLIEAPDGTAIRDAIQTDAAINPGNSGGPLLDRLGRVIGVNSQIATGSSGGGNVGIGFAVPAETVRSFVERAGETIIT